MEWLRDMLSVLGVVILPALGYLNRRINIMAKQLEGKIDKEELHEYIDLKLLPGDVRQQEMKEDLKEIKLDVKKLIDKLSRT